jgi:hypothetical protein
MEVAVSLIGSTALKVALTTFIILSLGALTSCGYQGWVRYPCQEFENWEKPECKPPQCIPTGTCTKDILPGVVDE